MCDKFIFSPVCQSMAFVVRSFITSIFLFFTFSKLCCDARLADYTFSDILDSVFCSDALNWCFFIRKTSNLKSLSAYLYLMGGFNCRLHSAVRMWIKRVARVFYCTDRRMSIRWTRCSNDWLTDGHYFRVLWRSLHCHWVWILNWNDFRHAYRLHIDCVVYMHDWLQLL